MSQASSGNTNDDDEFFDEGSSTLLIPEDVMRAIDQVYFNYRYIIQSIIVTPGCVYSVMTNGIKHFQNVIFMSTLNKN